MARQLAKAFMAMLAAAMLVVIALWVTHQFTPRPAVAAIRWLFDSGAADAAQILQKQVPAGVQARRDVAVSASSGGIQGRAFDLYLPPDFKAGELRPALIWVHGGGWVSGRKEDMGPWLQVLAGQGFITVSLDYTIAPEATYPQPLHELNAALAQISRDADSLGIDRNRLLMGGDSAGAHLVAMLAAMHTRPEYARAVGLQPALQASQLRGLLLFCGPYDFSLVRFDGVFGPFLRTVVWAFFGERDAERLPAFDQASVLRHVDGAFPPSFISAGNKDPLLLHSVALARKLRELKVPVEDLFFADDHQPALGHEYQFNLDTAAARQAFDRAVAFSRLRTAPD